MTQPTNLPGLLRLRTRHAPDKIALRCDDESWSYARLQLEAGRIAAGLVQRGVKRGDPVCVLLETSCDYVATWLAINWIGAIEVPINTGFRGEALAHALRLTGSHILIADAEFTPLLLGVIPDIASIEQVVLRGSLAQDNWPARLTVTAFEALRRSGAAVPDLAKNRPGDTAMLLFTSGSTGPSKACKIPHGYVLGQPEIFCRELGIGADDVLYAPFPLFHADGAIFTVAAALSAGATAALARRFSATRFWDDCRRYGATVIDYMGATLTMLHRQPPSPGDRDHSVRLGWGVPAPPFADAFEARFGFQLVEVYGLSDAGIPIYNRPGEARRDGSCGRVVAPFDVRLRHADGHDVADGEIGEIVIHADDPSLLTTGYFGDPDATRAALRDGWLHTGDLARRDSDGYFYFVGRVKDIIRRRGENISAFDIEQVLLAHPDIVEAAAYGVPSEMTEEDVMVTIVPRAGAAIDAASIHRWVADRVARHMVPRFIRVADAMPRTPTEKVAKHILIAGGVPTGTIDFDPPRPVAKES